jgi:hypothetical protein
MISMVIVLNASLFPKQVHQTISVPIHDQPKRLLL